MSVLNKIGVAILATPLVFAFVVIEGGRKPLWTAALVVGLVGLWLGVAVQMQ